MRRTYRRLVPVKGCIIRSMKKESTFHFWYLFLAIWGILFVHDLWVQMNAIETIPYNQFLTYLSSGNVSEVSITKDRILGKLKDAPKGKPHEFMTVRVDKDLADLLARGNIKFTGVVEDTFLRGLLSWLVPTLIFFAIWMWLIRRLAEKEGG